MGGCSVIKSPAGRSRTIGVSAMSLTPGTRYGWRAGMVDELRRSMHSQESRTGHSDGYPPGGVDAHESNKFLGRLPYDLMAIGK
ncbi:hypothetical protein EDD15DRAFT_2292276 [Pisolithus albus]|nr:hypothetical protein EDD15DRAFT_2292276 [Pisolithus albus]